MQAMGQMTWRGTDDLIQRVRRSARAHGRSMNDYVTAVLDAATNPDLAGDDAAMLRERLDQAGLLAPAGRARKRPAAGRVVAARAVASRGTPLAQLVEQGRRVGTEADPGDPTRGRR